MCYIDAMIQKGLSTLAALVALAAAPALLSAQAVTPSSNPAAAHSTAPLVTLASKPIGPNQAAPAVTKAAKPLAPAAPTAAVPVPDRPDCGGVPCEEQQPRVIVTLPPPAPTVWKWQDRVLWGVYLVLALVGYIGVMVALSTLKKIERHTAASEEIASAAASAATAAAETAQAALLQAQALANAERPWILVTAEPTRGVESSFEITATNRGRSPATVTAAFDQVLFAPDEASLPLAPESKPVASAARFVPIILLPGESAKLRTFSRADARGVCASDEQFKNVESWSERIFLCGKVAYNDLIAPAGKEAHQTNWCCWYIHGKQRSALVPAGPAAYNAHT
ncbi:MAG: hypothetical protein P4L26_04650 [Terracidiphilus sp.]|nr:hypothetical protein [Terracidiphilus sp.]